MNNNSLAKIHEQQIADKKALQKSFIDKKEQERLEIAERASRFAEQDRMVADLRKQAQMNYKNDLDNQVTEKINYLKPGSRSASERGRDISKSKNLYGAIMSSISIFIGFYIKLGQEKAAELMEKSIDPRKNNPIVNPIENSDNPYIDGLRLRINNNRSILSNAAKQVLY